MEKDLFDRDLFCIFLIPLFQICIKVADKIIDRVGGSQAMGIALCKKGKHNWEKVPSYKFLRVCTRCPAVDDISTDGIDSEIYTREEIFSRAERDEQ